VEVPLIVVRTVRSDAELKRCLALRFEVFVDEQGVSERDELDDLDPVCAHFLAFDDDKTALEDAIGTARLWPTPEGKAKAQRVAVRAAHRGRGAGEALMAALEDEARARGLSEVVLGAQLSALGFYERLGYAAFGDVFDDAGIPHRMMKKDLAPRAADPV